MADPVELPVAAIEVVEARTHNLRGVDCRIPHGTLTVITGVSGSGKSSLAFDTVYAEGQRRYVETLSTYARQFLQQMRKPPVRAVRNMPPALALRQGHGTQNARSSVGTITELNDHIHVLFSSAGTVICGGCGAVVRPQTGAMVRQTLLAEHPGARILVVAAVRATGADGMAERMRQLATDGHRRLYEQGRIVEIDGPDAAAFVDHDTLRIVIDRLQVQPDDLRILEAIEAARGMGEGLVDVVLWDDKGDDGVPKERRFYSGWRCSTCHLPWVQPIPPLFNPQSSIGKCPDCDGFGRTAGLDPTRVVADPRKTLEGDAVVCFDTQLAGGWQARLLQAAIKRGVPIDIPWMRMTEADRRWVLHGGPGWPGVAGFFTALEEDRYKPHVRIFLARFRGYTECARCEGSGLSDAARAVQVQGRTVADLGRLRLTELQAWADALDLGEEANRAFDSLLRELRARTAFLVEAGTGYLTLARQARTLSGGEMHRVMLATSVGRMLTDTCYVLDEPTAGLHPRDTARLMQVIERLRDNGNTVVVVEHDPDVIRLADWVIEMGPDAGEQGGLVLFEGNRAALAARGDLATTAAMQRRGFRPRTASPTGPWLILRDACLHNLQNVEARFAHGAFNVVTGVSGSGKSTLVTEVLHGLLLERRGQQAPHLAPASLEGDVFAEIVHVDQDSLPRSSRSCPLTLSGAYTGVRELYAAQPRAAELGLTPGHFSFNTPGGRCEVCEGTGVVTVEMHFLADVELPCEACDGRRFGPTVREVRYRDRSLSDVFEMTVREATTFFADHPSIVRKLTPLLRVGLGYLRMGQTTSRMSGGELQRLKLASYIGQGRGGDQHHLFLFDEPTVGLHMRDVEVLLGALRELVDAGHTVVVVEHNLDLIAAADWVVDLGPDAGPGGGTIVYQGPVAGLVDVSASLTGLYLRHTFAGGEA